MACDISANVSPPVLEHPARMPLELARAMCNCKGVLSTASAAWPSDRCWLSFGRGHMMQQLLQEMGPDQITVAVSGLASVLGCSGN